MACDPTLNPVLMALAPSTWPDDEIAASVMAATHAAYDNAPRLLMPPLPALRPISLPDGRVAVIMPTE